MNLEQLSSQLNEMNALLNGSFSITTTTAKQTKAVTGFTQEMERLKAAFDAYDGVSETSAEFCHKQLVSVVKSMTVIVEGIRAREIDFLGGII